MLESAKAKSFIMIIWGCNVVLLHLVLYRLVSQYTERCLCAVWNVCKLLPCLHCFQAAAEVIEAWELCSGPNLSLI